MQRWGTRLYIKGYDAEVEATRLPCTSRTTTVPNYALQVFSLRRRYTAWERPRQSRRRAGCRCALVFEVRVVARIIDCTFTIVIINLVQSVLLTR